MISVFISYARADGSETAFHENANQSIKGFLNNTLELSLTVLTRNAGDFGHMVHRQPQAC
jgi:hypothetical protein